MVQLKYGDYIMIDDRDCDFNSCMVQLKSNCQKTALPSKTDFNSCMVQLKLVLLKRLSISNVF